MWILRKMAWPISLLYGLVVYVRNWLYDHEILKSKTFNVPTVCIGNLSVGGTGKTPMIEFLISRLQDSYKLAVLSRGYKRKSEGFQLASRNATVAQLGDEPFQIHQKFPKVTVAVDIDRRNGISQLAKKVRPALILLDDAFQHRKVRPTISVLLTTYDRPYFKDTYLPTGSLRDSKRAASRADMIVVTKCPASLSEKGKDFFVKSLRTESHQKVLFSTLVYDERLYGRKNTAFLDELKGVEFTLVTGIANPRPLLDHLNDKGLTFEHLKFADHHDFSVLEVERLKSKARIITTEKDYVRLVEKLPQLEYIKIVHQFLGNGEQELLEAVRLAIKPYH